MAEYIKREDLQVALQKKKAHAANGRYTEGWNDCLMLFKSMVSCFPAADVAPVVHGWWVGVDSSYWRWTPSGAVPIPHITYSCERCGRGTVVKTHYCPNCGAKMDGEDEK